jgi:hypothetical protein
MTAVCLLLSLLSSRADAGDIVPERANGKSLYRIKLKIEGFAVYWPKAE